MLVALMSTVVELYSPVPPQATTKCAKPPRTKTFNGLLRMNPILVALVQIPRNLCIWLIPNLVVLTYLVSAH